MNPQPDLLPENPAPGDPTLKDAPGTAASTMAITSSDDSGKKSPPPTEGAGENVLLHESPASAALPLSLDSYVTPKSNKRLRKTKDGETSDKPRRPLSGKLSHDRPWFGDVLGNRAKLSLAGSQSKAVALQLLELDHHNSVTPSSCLGGSCLARSSLQLLLQGEPRGPASRARREAQASQGAW